MRVPKEDLYAGILGRSRADSEDRSAAINRSIHLTW